MYMKTWDPEGVLSTLPAIATTLLGPAGRRLAPRASRRPRCARRASWSWGRRWRCWAWRGARASRSTRTCGRRRTSLFTGGLAGALFGLVLSAGGRVAVSALDEAFTVYGTNAIFLYVAAALVTRTLRVTKVTAYPCTTTPSKRCSGTGCRCRRRPWCGRPGRGALVRRAPRPASARHPLARLGAPASSVASAPAHPVPTAPRRSGTAVHVGPRPLVDVAGVGGRRTGDVQHLAAMAVHHTEVTVAQVDGLPLVVGGGAAVGVLDDVGAVRGGGARDVQVLAAVPVDDAVVAAPDAAQLPLVVVQGVVVVVPLVHVGMSAVEAPATTTALPLCRARIR